MAAEEQLTQNYKRNETKNFLSRLFKAKMDIKRKQTSIDRLRSMLAFAAVKPRDVRIRSSRSNDRLERLVCDILVLEQEIEGLEFEVEAVRHEITEGIARIKDDRFKKVLTLRYLDCRKWEEIEVLMGYTWRWTMRLHADALEEYKKKAMASH